MFIACNKSCPRYHIFLNRPFKHFHRSIHDSHFSIYIHKSVIHQLVSSASSFHNQTMHKRSYIRFCSRRRFRMEGIVKSSIFISRSCILPNKDRASSLRPSLIHSTTIEFQETTSSTSISCNKALAVAKSLHLGIHSNHCALNKDVSLDTTLNYAAMHLNSWTPNPRAETTSN